MLRFATRLRRARGAGSAVYFATASAVAVSASLLATKTGHIQNDVLVTRNANADVGSSSSNAKRRPSTERTVLSDKDILENLIAFSWGYGQQAAPSPLSPGSSSESRRVPGQAAVFSGLALRDLVLHDSQNALVDASGDVYSWSSSDAAPPRCLLKGKDVVSIALSGTKVFALSKSGKIHSLDTNPSSSPPSPSPSSNSASSSWLSYIWPSSSPEQGVLQPSSDLARKESFVSLSAGNDHLLALTSQGRTFAHPISLSANSHGQLGTRKVLLSPSPSSSSSSSSSPHDPAQEIELTPRSQSDPYAMASPFLRSASPSAEKGEEKQQQELAPLLYEIPALKGLKVSKVVASDRSSYVLTEGTGRVLAWGANEYGQLGLGSGAIVPAVSVPAEIPLSKWYPSGSSVQCVDVVAGGNVAYFAVESSSLQTSTPGFDLLACGMGQYGALGNGTYVQAQSTPVKAKIISGNTMFNEQTNTLDAIRLHSLSASPTGHVLASFSSGKDVLTWGSNASYQLGNGKRSNISVPTYLQDLALPPSASVGVDGTIVGADGTTVGVDGTNGKQGRMALRSGVVRELRNFEGKRVGRDVGVSQCAIAGWGASGVYWRID